MIFGIYFLKIAYQNYVLKLYIILFPTMELTRGPDEKSHGPLVGNRYSRAMCVVSALHNKPDASDDRRNRWRCSGTYITQVI